MTLHFPVPGLNKDDPIGRQAALLSLWMLPVAFVCTLAAGVVGYTAMGWLGMAEGDLLTTAVWRGWLAVLVVLVVMASPLVVALVSGVRAVRTQAGAVSWVALAAASVSLLFLVVLPSIRLFGPWPEGATAVARAPRRWGRVSQLPGYAGGGL